ncbi:trehalose-phosphatase [Sphingomonas ginsenosidivorax]|uniref:Trehalose 6-phosphate phosphatase n=1 Tax=Sphingomonas ginsenosidivorax TaxID=862135 RepID=A0A5C6UCH1_9SPHN|nr:trehalose-phosphatase [Sphingomonas ginsenosidivorax]TXC69725.1 trehalose-phosphatase [Sphingomonas ginsenosidivorax]
MPAERLSATPDRAPPLSLGETSLFFDFDGTLVDLAETPDAVVVEPALLTQLDALAARLPGRVAIISGRSIAQLDAMLGGHARLFAVAGSHGAERRTPDEGHVTPQAPQALERAAAELAAYAAANDLVFEAKSLGAALHYRTRPDREAEAVRFVEQVAETRKLTLQRGKMMVEVRSPGDKGAALTTLMAAPTMAGTTPLFFGDDVTDEDGFVAAAALGGDGVLIGAPRPTAATYRLGDVNALRDWIAAILET